MAKIHLPDSFRLSVMKRGILALSWQHDENKRKNIVSVPNFDGFAVCDHFGGLHGSGGTVNRSGTRCCN